VATFRSSAGDALVEVGANGQGYMHFFGDASTAGSVLGHLEISHPLIGTRRVDPFALEADYRVAIPRIRGDVPIDGGQRWSGEVVDRRISLAAKVPGVGITFERTGGVVITPQVIRTTTTAQGVFILDFGTPSFGEVRGTLTLTPTTGWAPVVYRNVTFTTHLPGAVGYLGLFAFGERWAWAFELWRHDMLIPMPNLPYRLIRVGGLAITPSSSGTDFSSRTDCGR
jgi:hypothetical protein